MKKTYKVLSILMIALVIISCAYVVNAASMDQITANTEFDGNETITEIGSTIIGVITVVGMVLAVAVIAVLGVKYMMGSTEEKAEYKKSMMPYLVGAVLVFAASAIGTAVYNFANGLNEESGESASESATP